jgi:hypothetical protein
MTAEDRAYRTPDLDLLAARVQGRASVPEVVQVDGEGDGQGRGVIPGGLGHETDDAPEPCREQGGPGKRRGWPHHAGDGRRLDPDIEGAA